MSIFSKLRKKKQRVFILSGTSRIRIEVKADNPVEALLKAMDRVPPFQYESYTEK